MERRIYEVSDWMKGVNVYEHYHNVCLQIAQYWSAWALFWWQMAGKSTWEWDSVNGFG